MMKKLIYPIIIISALASDAVALPPAPSPVFSQVEVVVLPENKAAVKFSVYIPKKTVRNNRVLKLTPIITDGHQRISMPSVMIEGTGSRITRIRSEWASGAESSHSYYSRNGDRLNYYTEVETENWMKGCSIKIEQVLAGCCSSLLQDDILLLDKMPENIQMEEMGNVSTISEPTRDITAEPEHDGDYYFSPVSLADSISLSFPFVTEISYFDPADPLNMDRNDRENAVVVYFQQGHAAINENYKDNKQMLSNLTSSIDMILTDSGSRIEKVVIGGFTSPEGGTAVNEQMAQRRAESIKEYITSKTGLPRENIIIYNGSVDWRGLRLMIYASDLPERNEILRIIDEVPVWDSQAQRGRHGELMRLNGGSTYRRLQNEFFPLMRSGACIKVFYSNKD